MPASCQTADSAAQHLLADAARLGDEIPPLRDSFSRFAALLAGRARVREAAPGWTGALPVVDEERFCQGVPLLAESGFQDVAAQIPAAAALLLPVMEEAFPPLADELAALRRALEDGTLAPAQVLTACTAPAGAPTGVADETFAFAARQLVAPCIEAQARSLAPLLRDLPWRRPQCPVCGGAPHFSRLMRDNERIDFMGSQAGIRHLRCATCATEWRYKRVSCPVCGNEDPAHLGRLADPDRPTERADVCEKCKTYCLCQDATDLVTLPDPELAALAMLPLELRVREAGYTPIAPQPWLDL